MLAKAFEGLEAQFCLIPGSLCFPVAEQGGLLGNGSSYFLLTPRLPQLRPQNFHHHLIAVRWPRAGDKYSLLIQPEQELAK
jgi:hypothetical protein